MRNPKTLPKAEPATYSSWNGMINRCSGRAAPYTHGLYAGRGIRVCDRWKVFANFFHDMGPRPPGLSLDRINNDGNYEPGNCRWATRKEQNSNKRKPVRTKRPINPFGIPEPLEELDQDLGVQLHVTTTHCGE